MNQQPIIKFLGAAQTVTGSKTVVSFNNFNVLIDCGLFQGLKELRQLNRAEFPISPAKIDVVLLTHGHLDHCGYLPLLVKNGFKGEIHCTHPTQDLAEIILKDSAKIQEEDATRAQSHGYSKHEKAEPLYTIKDVMTCLNLFVGHDLSEWVILNNDFKFQFLNSGHIIGGAFVDLLVDSKKLLFTGDIGRLDPMLLYPPKTVKEADYVIMESTYGDRAHQETDVKTALLEVIKETVGNKGILMIPSFAVERTQEIIYLLHQLREENLLPNIPLYLDSPMGIDATRVYYEYKDWQRLSRLEIEQMYKDVFFVSDTAQSKLLVQDKKPKIIIAGSGMLEGGRILHYLNTHLENPLATLLFVGYQGQGTRGRAIMEGSTEIKFFGEYKKVLCQIRNISSLSAHADRNEMITWLKKFSKSPKRIFLNHGEPHQSDALRVKIEHELKIPVSVPHMMESFELI
jgi:metallo-beta-lactamase family protein